MKKIFLILFVTVSIKVTAQNVGIGTTSPQATIDVRGNQRLGGSLKYTSYDSITGRIGWTNSNLFVPAPQYLMQHSASGEGLFYGNGKLLYRGVSDTAFYTDWGTGNGFFKGSLGVGTASPVEKLDVNGNIKANSFKYATPKTLYYSIPDGAFTARSSSEVVQKSFSSGGASIVGATTNFGLVAPVYLPHNARLISIKVDFYDVSPTQDVVFYLVKQFSNGFSFDATLSSTGNSGLITQTLAVTPSQLIDNSINAYEIFVIPSTGNWTTQDLAIRRVIMGYTVDEAF